MAKNKDKKKKEREKRVAKKKLEEAAKRRETLKEAAEKDSTGVMSKKISKDAASKANYEKSTQLPRKLGG
ncbi:MAG: hypothetical protein AB8G99_18365 [Planctomycetaceae bacterium]